MTEDTFTEGGDEIEAGAYNATLTKIERKTSKADGSTFRVWTFHTPEGLELGGTSSVMSGPASKAARWAKAILGRVPVPGEAIGMLYGKPCIVSVEKNDKDYGRVVDVFPASVARRVTPTATVPAPAPASPDGPAPEWDGAAIEAPLVDDPIPF